MKRTINIIFAFLLTTLLCGCMGDIIVSHYEQVPDSEWHKDSALCFPFSATDNAGLCDIGLNIRHNTTYPFQNIWLFTELFADSTLLLTDTLEYFLADQRGVWLGNGSSRLRDMPCLWLKGIEIDEGKTYMITVRQGMREDVLCGVESVGVTVKKTE